MNPPLLLNQDSPLKWNLLLTHQILIVLNVWRSQIILKSMVILLVMLSWLTLKTDMLPIRFLLPQFLECVDFQFVRYELLFNSNYLSFLNFFNSPFVMFPFFSVEISWEREYLFCFLPKSMLFSWFPSSIVIINILFLFNYPFFNQVSDSYCNANLGFHSSFIFK